MLCKLKFRTLSLVMLLFISMFSLASASPIIPISAQPPEPASLSPASPNVNAKGFILLDGNSGKVLAEKNADERMAPASLTKLMTMYIISNSIKNGVIHLDDKVRISTKAWQTGGSRMFVKVNDEVPVADLLRGIVVASGNDASVAMAEHIAGSEESFASMMNTQAKELGMTNSHFMDSNGLPNPSHYSTPRDLALLTQAIIKNFPDDYRIYSEKWFTFNGIRQPNRNRLLWRFQYADGLKTGHTDDAGYCLVASAVKDGTRLISIVMGAPNDRTRTEDSIRLLTYGFRFFETRKVYNAAKPLTQARVWKGENKETPLGLAEDLFVTLPNGQYKNLKTQFQFQSNLNAPIKKGEKLGTLSIVLNNQVLVSKPLIALDSNEKGGIWRRMADAVSSSFHKLFARSTEKANNG